MYKFIWGPLKWIVWVVIIAFSWQELVWASTGFKDTRQWCYTAIQKIATPSSFSQRQDRSDPHASIEVVRLGRDIYMKDLALVYRQLGERMDAQRNQIIMNMGLLYRLGMSDLWKYPHLLVRDDLGAFVEWLNGRGIALPRIELPEITDDFWNSVAKEKEEARQISKKKMHRFIYREITIAGLINIGAIIWAAFLDPIHSPHFQISHLLPLWISAGALIIYFIVIGEYILGLKIPRYFALSIIFAFPLFIPGFLVLDILIFDVKGFIQGLMYLNFRIPSLDRLKRRGFYQEYFQLSPMQRAMFILEDLRSEASAKGDRDLVETLERVKGFYLVEGDPWGGHVFHLPGGLIYITERISKQPEVLRYLILRRARTLWLLDQPTWRVIEDLDYGDISRNSDRFLLRHWRLIGMIFALYTWANDYYNMIVSAVIGGRGSLTWDAASKEFELLLSTERAGRPLEKTKLSSISHAKESALAEIKEGKVLSPLLFAEKYYFGQDVAEKLLKELKTQNPTQIEEIRDGNRVAYLAKQSERGEDPRWSEFAQRDPVETEL